MLLCILHTIVYVFSTMAFSFWLLGIFSFRAMCGCSAEHTAYRLGGQHIAVLFLCVNVQYLEVVLGLS